MCHGTYRDFITFDEPRKVQLEQHLLMHEEILHRQCVEKGGWRENRKDFALHFGSDYNVASLEETTEEKTSAKLDIHNKGRVKPLVERLCIIPESFKLRKSTYSGLSCDGNFISLSSKQNELQKTKEAAENAFEN